MFLKSYKQKCDGNMRLFSLLLMFVNIVFSGAFFYNFFNRCELSVKFCVSCYLFDFFQKKMFVVILALFENFEANVQKPAQKIRKRIL